MQSIIGISMRPLFGELSRRDPSVEVPNYAKFCRKESGSGLGGDLSAKFGQSNFCSVFTSHFGGMRCDIREMVFFFVIDYFEID